MSLGQSQFYQNSLGPTYPVGCLLRGEEEKMIISFSETPLGSEEDVKTDSSVYEMWLGIIQPHLGLLAVHKINSGRGNSWRFGGIRRVEFGEEAQQRSGTTIFPSLYGIPQIHSPVYSRKADLCSLEISRNPSPAWKLITLTMHKELNPGP